MMKRAAVVPFLVLPLYATAAHADEVAQQQLSPPATVAPTPVAPATPAPTVIAVVAPQNEDWANVSHINGHPVKVGERGDYLYKFKKTNISVNPFGPFFGYYEGSVAYGVSQNLAVSVSMAAYSHNSDTMFQMTASAPLFFRHTFSGIYLEPGLIYRSSSSSSYAYDAASCTSCQTSSDNSWVGPELLVGYQWNFDSGLNISYALGLAKHLGGDQMDSSDNVDFNGYFRAGYNF